MQLSCSNTIEQPKTFTFDVCFVGQMEMYGDIDTVSQYFKAHEEWFCRCAQPMQVEPLSENGYILTVGKYGSFGYEIEPKIGVVLLPPTEYTYPMHTTLVPNYEPQGYQVNYQAQMILSELPIENMSSTSRKLLEKAPHLPPAITLVDWELELQVKVEFPQFIARLSPRLLQTTGDRLLAQIIRQVSPRLTYKVQQDFHQSRNLPMPSKAGRKFQRVKKTERQVA